ncbi:hypothetical protein TSAR_008322 [Trichomalopsis sarcophagae]|uniref:Uncharacterized protein n=1 Tax=Trichomalopsis sarcophagae TaxID=543379 RepID=A0A232FCF6_9HYME|nr:hypothetical protein TSAR_008322 [Trichomalopsis sarcophagae]
MKRLFGTHKTLHWVFTLQFFLSSLTITYTMCMNSSSTTRFL